jgi:hypothetical protein
MEFVVIPPYRIRIYSFFGVLICLPLACLAAHTVYEAFSLWQFDAMTGPRRHTVKEHLIFEEQPWRFVWYLAEYLFIFTLLGVIGLASVWGLIGGGRPLPCWKKTS